jgi:predicted transcriptional regulator
VTRALLSIRPQYARQIFSGNKKYEYRRVIFKKDVKLVIVYASSPLSVIIGEFQIEKIILEDLDMLWNTTQRHSGISREYFTEYFTGKTKGYAIKITKPLLYKIPVSLQETYGKKPPQSFFYL